MKRFLMKKYILVCCLTMSLVNIAQAQLPTHALVGYWHNWNDGNAPYIALDQIDPRYTVLELAFAVPAPGTTFDMVFFPAMTTPAALISEIAVLQAQGKKVLISIGGANATVQLNTDGERDQFVSSMLNILTTYDLDGIDIDLEGASVSITGGTIAMPVDPPVVRLVDAIGSLMTAYRTQYGRKMLLTMAPETAFVQGGQSSFGGIWGAYLHIIHALRDSIDLLQVQLYNSGSMYGIDGGIYSQGTADFIISQTEAVIQGFNTGGGFFNGLPPEKVAVGLPACNAAAGGGFVDTTTVRAAMAYLLGAGPQPGAYALVQPGGYPSLGGMMTWSVNWDAVMACDGAWSFAEDHDRIFAPLVTNVSQYSAVDHHVFPHPASERVTVVLGERPTAKVLDVDWYDMHGRVVRTMRTPAAERILLSVEGIPSGSYCLCIRSGGSLVVRTMIVVQ